MSAQDMATPIKPGLPLGYEYEENTETEQLHAVSPSVAQEASEASQASSSPSTRRPLKFATLEEAKAYRYQVKVLPDLQPDNDPTIAEVEADAPAWIARMVEAIHDMSDVCDRSAAWEKKKFEGEHDKAYSEDHIESACWVLFEAVIDRCKNGFRALAEEDKARGKGSYEEDRTANCRTRVQNVVECLRKWKNACNDIMISDFYIRRLANHPYRYAATKVSNQACNKQKKKEHEAGKKALAELAAKQPKKEEEDEQPPAKKARKSRAKQPLVPSSPQVAQAHAARDSSSSPVAGPQMTPASSPPPVARPQAPSFPAGPQMQMAQQFNHDLLYPSNDAWLNPVFHSGYGPDLNMHGAVNMSGLQQAVQPQAMTFPGHGQQYGGFVPSGPMNAPFDISALAANNAYMTTHYSQHLPNLTPGFAPANRFAGLNNPTNGAANAGSDAHAPARDATNGKRKRTSGDGDFVQTLAAMNERRHSKP
jgi:hypothetical protein